MFLGDGKIVALSFPYLKLHRSSRGSEEKREGEEGRCDSFPAIPGEEGGSQREGGGLR